MNKLDLEDRIAIVTGGAGGIGLGIAPRLGAPGAQVRLLDNHPDPDRGARGTVRAALTSRIQVTNHRRGDDAGRDRIGHAGEDDERAAELRAGENSAGPGRTSGGSRGDGRVARHRGLLVLDRGRVRSVGRTRDVLITTLDSRTRGRGVCRLYVSSRDRGNDTP